MQISKRNLTNPSKFTFISFLLILPFLFQACKKVDIPNIVDKNSQATVSTQAKDFFTISEKAPDALKAIVKEMQKQLKYNDVQDFLKWHGQPVWSKIVKFEADKNGAVTYAIPTQKSGEITGFFAATIGKLNNIQFEMHRKTAIALKKAEYSYADIEAEKRNAILQIFTGNIAVKQTQTNNLEGTFCWFEWILHTTFQKTGDKKTETSTANMEAPNGHWELHCVLIYGGGGGGTGGGGDPGGGGTGGGGTGGGCGGGGNTETFNYKWWNNEASLLSPCELIAVINRLSPILNLTPLQIHFLMERPDMAEEIDRYLTNNPQNVQIAKDHLEKLTLDVDYFNFVLGHAQTGDDQKMWWDDAAWLQINFKMGIDDDLEDLPPPTDLTNQEISFIIAHPIEAYMIRTNSYIAKSQAKSRYFVNGTADKSDAFRHTLWMALSAKDVGVVLAFEYGLAHESETPPQLNLDKEMDLLNNYVGVNVNTSGLTYSQIADNVETLVTVGMCRYLSPIWPPMHDLNGVVINPNGDPNFWGANGIPDDSTATHGITNLTIIIPTNQ
jgi:hypothetical protein